MIHCRRCLKGAFSRTWLTEKYSLPSLHQAEKHALWFQVVSSPRCQLILQYCTWTSEAPIWAVRSQGKHGSELIIKFWMLWSCDKVVSGQSRLFSKIGILIAAPFPNLLSRSPEIHIRYVWYVVILRYSYLVLPPDSLFNRVTAFRILFVFSVPYPPLMKQLRKKESLTWVTREPGSID